MEISKLRSDLEHLFHSLLRHPLLIDQPNKASLFKELYLSLIDSCIDDSSFITAACDLTSFFHDGHTNIEVTYTRSDLCLSILCHWHDNTLITDRPIRDIPAGTQIIGIENEPLSNILQKMCRRIPHENTHLVKSRMIRYPYQNYHLFSKLNLQWMFGPKKAYQIDFLVSGNIVSRTVALSAYDGFLDFPDDRNFIDWYIQNGAAYLQLNACICNETYIRALHKLAEACSKEHARSLTLDLSHNMGGSSAVIDPFISCIDTDSFRRYKMVSYNAGIPEMICSRDEIIPNARAQHLFPKQIYCVVGHDTFSSAKTFAVTLKDNGFATILGQPTGGKPSSYGMPKKGLLPSTGIRFRVSQALFLRPNATLDDEDSLTPDHTL